MLFNSYEFILGFLPVTVLAFLLLGARSRSLALGWLILASLFYYAWWRPFNLWIILPSIAVNYAFGRTLLSMAQDQRRSRARMLVLSLGIVFNLGLLGYFKYANFAVTVANDLSGGRFAIEEIILPLGLSFITFQKIAFLIDVAGGRIRHFALRDYMLFVLFFPQLIAGPIIHYRESIPQFDRASCKFDATLFAVGLTLFVFGLFKKVVLADGVAQHVTPVFAYAAAGEAVTLVQAWTAALGFTTQIYFDFSGYSDMACGAALLFGIRLPLNFDSPLKATNIIDFWLRWHVSLTRFLTAYVYNPLALHVTRRRAAAGKPVLGARGSRPAAFFVVLAVPTLLTMLLSGVWHGAGYTFIVWGLLHGGYLVGNHAWRQYVAKRTPAQAGAVGRAAGFALTFLAVVVAMVIFRAPDIATAINVLAGMAGFHGLGLPSAVADKLGMPGLGGMALLDGEVYPKMFAMSAATVAGVLSIALLAPNTLQVLARYEPTLSQVTRAPRVAGLGPLIYWQPSLRWLALVAMLLAISMVRVTGQSEFLYWQF
jgi:D-alanyl-lipoteichoic acid acyltransferase DltB (MBOAT superfamily)